MALTTLLSTLSAALTGKAAATVAGVTLAGGGLAIAVDAVQPADEATQDVPELEAADAEAVDVDLLVEENDTPADGAEDRGRSADVHDALTGDETEPGDEDFGQTVAENAREGGRDFGQNVAETARDGAGEEQSADGRARADEAGGEQEQAEQRQQEAQERREAARQRGTEGRDEAPDEPAAGADDARQDDDARGSAADNAGRAEDRPGR